MKKFNFKKMRKETTLMLASVFCVSITMISASYSIFFDVKTNQNEQTITTGELTVQFTNDSNSLSGVYLYPLSDADAISSSTQSAFYLQNSGTINGAFTFIISEGSSHTISNDYIKFAIFENDKQVSDIIKLSDCITMDSGDYLMYSSVLNSGSSATYTVKFWLDEYSPTSIIGDGIDIEISVNSEVLEAFMLYDFSGTFSDSDGILSNATISLNNGSYISTTNSSGEYSFDSLRSGTYSIAVTLEDGSIMRDILIIDEDVEVSTNNDSGSYTIYGGMDTDINANFTINTTKITSVEVN